MNKLEQEVNKRMQLEPTSIVNNINVEKDIFPKVYGGEKLTLSEAFAFIEAHASESITFGANNGYVMDYNKKDLVMALTQGNITTSDTMIIKSIVDAISNTPKSNFTSITSDDYKESVYNNVYPKYDNYLDFEYYYDFVIRLNPRELESIFNCNKLTDYGGIITGLSVARQNDNLLRNIRNNRHYSLFSDHAINKRICDRYDTAKNAKSLDFNKYYEDKDEETKRLNMCDNTFGEVEGLKEELTPIVKCSDVGTSPDFTVQTTITSTNTELQELKDSLTSYEGVETTVRNKVSDLYTLAGLTKPSSVGTLTGTAKPKRKVGRPKKTPTTKDNVKTVGFAQAEKGTRKKSKYTPPAVKGNRKKSKVINIKPITVNYETPDHITGKAKTTKGKK